MIAASSTSTEGSTNGGQHRHEDYGAEHPDEDLAARHLGYNVVQASETP
jgi:hypothetical protein